MGKKLTAEEIGQYVIDNPSTGFDQCSKCQGVEVHGAMRNLDDSKPFDDELICDECNPEVNTCSNCNFDMGEGYVNCGGAEDGTCPECNTVKEAAPEESYTVTVCRTGYGFAYIEVMASSPEEAEAKAMEEAGDHHYSEKASEYTPDGATRL